MKLSLSSNFFSRKTDSKKSRRINAEKYFSSSSKQKFFSTQARPASILEGRFNYNEAFSAFVKGTQQKKDTASIATFFINNLQDKQVSLQKPVPGNIADIGCADSKTCLQYLRNVNHSSGFNYFGIDTNRKFIEQAKKVLSTDPMIKKHTLIEGDALSGKLKQMKEFASTSFEFIFASHIAYYIKDELACQAFLADIIKLLSDCGIAIFFHEDSTHYFRSTYNENFNTISTPMLLAKSAQRLPANFNQFNTITFTSQLRFSPLSESLWEAAKYPMVYKNFAHEPHFIETLEKLAFVVQGDLLTLAKKGCLVQYIDEIKEAITENNHCLNLKTHMQTIVAPQCKLRHRIAKILEEIEEKIPNIVKQDYSDKSILKFKNNPLSVGYKH